MPMRHYAITNLGGTLCLVTAVFEMHLAMRFGLDCSELSRELSAQKLERLAAPIVGLLLGHAGNSSKLYQNALELRKI